MQLSHILIVLFAAAVTSAVATPVAARLAHWFDAVDRPNERKVNRREDIPLLGGLAVAIGVLIGIAVAGLGAGDSVIGSPQIEGYLIGATLLLAVGAFDDRWGLSAVPKLVVQIAAAAVAIRFGYEIPHLTEPISRTTIDMPAWVGFAVTTAWIVGVTNAVNLIDGLDGLAAGLGAIITARLVVICWQADQLAGVVLGAALLGALLGFLPFNFPPARIFLGDTGALFIGYTLALLALEGHRQPALLTFVVPLLALAVPLLDTLLSIFRRLREGRPVFSADMGHMHHRLLAFERSDRRAVLSLYFLTACFCVIAVSFIRLKGYVAIVFLGAVVILTLRLLRNLDILGAQADGSPALSPNSTAEVEES